MKKEKLIKENTDEQPVATAETAVQLKSTAKKKKNGDDVAKGATDGPKKVSNTKKSKDTVKKQGKSKGEEKEKPSKEDKTTKFLVSMKKSLRKSVKKEAAEAGISMNTYIVSAVEQKLLNDTAKE